MNNVLVDFWEKDIRLQKLIDDKNKSNTLSKYKYVNILEYCKVVYNINVTNLGKLFNVERQTIYNYYKLSSADLSDLILNTICLVYNFKSIDLVIEKELLLFIDHEKNSAKKTKEFRESIMNGFISIIHNSEDIYKHFINNPITPLISSLLKKNDMRYVSTMMEILNKTNVNSVKFLAYLKDYERSDFQTKDDKYNVYERIDSILSRGPGLISIDFVDFEPINEIHLLYTDEVNDASELRFIVPENICTDNLIVNITSSKDFTLSQLEEILTIIRKNIIKKTNILFGHIIDENRRNTIVDVFAHEK